MTALGGKHALVVGAGRGIGRAAALALAAAGAAVTLVSRTAPELEAVAAEIAAGGGDARATSADVRDPAAIADAVTAAHAYRPLDILVNSAGLNRPGPLAETPLSDLDLILDTNLRGTLCACRAYALAAIPAGRGGAVVNVSSQLGTVGYPGRAAYCASKHAVNGLTKALALEWAPHGIRVNAVAPTFVHTPFTEPMFAQPHFRDEVLARIPLGRIAEVDDITGAILFLVSEEASMVTGHVLAVDGGWTAQ